MPRVFVSLAVAELLVLFLTAGIGLAHLDERADRHVLLGVLTLLLSCLIQVVLFTFFSVAGRTMSQAIHLGGLPMAPVEEMKKLKKNILYGLAFVMLANLLVVASGAHGWQTGQQGALHWLSATMLVCAHALVYYVQYGYVCAGASLLDQVLCEYRSRSRA